MAGRADRVARGAGGHEGGAGARGGDAEPLGAVHALAQAPLGQHDEQPEPEDHRGLHEGHRGQPQRRELQADSGRDEQGPAPPGPAPRQVAQQRPAASRSWSGCRASPAWTA